MAADGNRRTLWPLLGYAALAAVALARRDRSHRDVDDHPQGCPATGAFGNTRAALINLRKDQVAWTAAQPTRYASSKFALRGFCGHCGTPLTFEYLSSDHMDLSVGSFDDPGALRPVSHFAVESRIASWHAPDGLPGTRLDTSARIQQRWRFPGRP